MSAIKRAWVFVAVTSISLGLCAVLDVPTHIQNRLQVHRNE